MIVFAATLAMVLLATGAVRLYLTTAHQRLLPAPLPLRARWIGGACLVGALVILLGLTGTATAVFTWAIGLMAAWTIPPVVIGWLHYRKGTGS